MGGAGGGGGGAGGNVDARVTGSGGSGGRPAPDALPPVGPESCMPPRSRFCPARGLQPAVCIPSSYDCSTVAQCPDGVRACREGWMVDCRYRADFCFLPGDTCQDDPEYPVACAAMGEIGPSCYSAGADCSTRTICGNETDSRACGLGQKVDCNYREDYCLPPRACSGDYPQSCPAMGEFGPGCWAARIDCSTRKICGSQSRACTMGRTVDCRYRADYCVFPGEVCRDPMFPVSCPAMGDVGPKCFGREPGDPAIDCNGRVVCEGERSATYCFVGYRVDCTKPDDESRCVPINSPDAAAPADGPPRRDGSAG
jgi:hypothetical protein